YFQHYSYDAWGNTIEETNRLWTGNTTTSSSSLTNNRRQHWIYDAMGFVTASSSAGDWSFYDYNASGKRTHVVPGFPWLGSVPAVEMDDIYDGDGLPSKRVDTRRVQDGE